MKGHVSYERAPMCGYTYTSHDPHCNIISLYLIHIIFLYIIINIFTTLKWIIAYCPIYIGYLHSEPGWFTTFLDLYCILRETTIVSGSFVSCTCCIPPSLHHIYRLIFQTGFPQGGLSRVMLTKNTCVHFHVC